MAARTKPNFLYPQLPNDKMYEEALGSSWGLDSYYILTDLRDKVEQNNVRLRVYSPIEKAVIGKFGDNSFWTRDAATRLVASQMKTPQDLDDTVKYAFASKDYMGLKSNSDYSQEAYRFKHSLAKMVGLSARDMGLKRHTSDGVAVVSYRGSIDHVLVWDPLEPETAMRNVGGKIEQLNKGWEKGYYPIQSSFAKKAVLV